MICSIFGSPVVFLHRDDAEQLFPTREYLHTLEYLTQQQFQGHDLSRGGAIHTSSGYLVADQWQATIQALPELVQVLKQAALNHAYLYTDHTVNDLLFHSSWVNVMYQHCEVNLHCDRSQPQGRSIIVLFYPRAPQGGSNLVFMHHAHTGAWPSDVSEQDLVRVQIQQGDIVIFHNDLLHAVDAHSVAEPRMSMAIEFLLED
jgi:ectoine hydroxylase-related dioxygenase (phytanoyl-CoA dioxygenase family)